MSENREGKGSSVTAGAGYVKSSSVLFLLTWILGVVSKQLRLLNGGVGDSTTLVNSLSPQMSELVEDAVGS